MSKIAVVCPRCGSLSELNAAFAGAVARCANCRAMIAVPEDAAPIDEGDEGDDRAPAAGDVKPGGRGRRSRTAWLLAGLAVSVVAATATAAGVVLLAGGGGA